MVHIIGMNKGDDMEMESVEFKVNVTEDDIIDYNMRIAYGRVSTWVLMALSILIVSFTIYGVLFRPAGIVVDWTMILTAVFASTYLFVMPTMLKFSSKSIFKRNPQYKYPFFYHFSNECIKLTINKKVTIINWDNLYKFVETKDTFLIHIARGRAYIVPKRSLAGDDMIWDIKQIVKENVDMSRLNLKYKTK